MQAWITDRPQKKRQRRNHDGLQQLQLPLHAPAQEIRDTKADVEVKEAPRGACDVDFYI